MEKDLSRSLRKHVAEFCDHLIQVDMKRLFFLYDVPLGIQERLNTPFEVFQHLECTAVLDFNRPATIVSLMRDLHKEKWAQDTEKKFGGTLAQCMHACSLVMHSVVHL